jgi:hypothetical protein
VVKKLKSIVLAAHHFPIDTNPAKTKNIIIAFFLQRCRTFGAYRCAN